MTANEGLRERKKRAMRQRISDTATHMFLERGFDHVTVAEVAAACDVSEKTVYNYFPNKEALMLDREQDMAERIRQRFGPDGASQTLVDVAMSMLREDAAGFRDFWNASENNLAMFRRFMEIVDTTPSLRAASRDVMERLTETTTHALAERARARTDDALAQITANALMGLWRLQMACLRRYANEERTPDDIYKRTMADVRRAARLLDAGLHDFGATKRR